MPVSITSKAVSGHTKIENEIIVSEIYVHGMYL